MPTDRITILDGALATELEARGADLRDPLWSARLLLDNPALIEQVHYDYFAAGADVATSASYQASFEGFQRRGIDGAKSARLMTRSVHLAQDARARFLATPQAQGRGPLLVAASIGPYGATLHDGSEYRGDYGLSVAQLMEWHRPRLHLLARSGADLLACETIPCLAEVEALLRLLEETGAPGWISVSAGDGAHLNHGEPIAEAAAMVEGCAQVVAFGVNCTPPRYIEHLLHAAGSATTKPLLCYPNSGERWDAAAGCWLDGGDALDWGRAAQRWVAAGARWVGGCCRTGPAEIAALGAALVD